MNNIETLIRAYEKAGEELADGIAVAVLGRKLTPTVTEGRELMDRIQFGQILGARAERNILEGVALGTALEIIKRKIGEQK